VFAVERAKERTVERVKERVKERTVESAEEDAMEYWEVNAAVHAAGNQFVSVRTASRRDV